MKMLTFTLFHACQRKIHTEAVALAQSCQWICLLVISKGVNLDTVKLTYYDRRQRLRDQTTQRRLCADAGHIGAGASNFTYSCHIWMAATSEAKKYRVLGSPTWQELLLHVYQSLCPLCNILEQGVLHTYSASSTLMFGVLQVYFSPRLGLCPALALN